MATIDPLIAGRGCKQQVIAVDRGAVGIPDIEAKFVSVWIALASRASRHLAAAA
jgi:hypothetical protein